MIFHDQRPEQARRLILSTDGENFKIGPHFRLKEMASKDGADIVKVHLHLIAMLEVIRAQFRRPVIINSGYRTQSHNRSIGGAAGSKHLLGMAADIRLPDVSPEEVAAFASNELQAGGVGRYSTFTHVDVYGKSRRWSG